MGIKASYELLPLPSSTFTVASYRQMCSYIIILFALLVFFTFSVSLLISTILVNRFPISSFLFLRLGIDISRLHFSYLAFNMSEIFKIYFVIGAYDLL